MYRHKNDLSPIKSGTLKAATLSIEYKKGDVQGQCYEKLLHQLHTNMVSASVECFVKELKQ